MLLNILVTSLKILNWCFAEAVLVYVLIRVVVNSCSMLSIKSHLQKSKKQTNKRNEIKQATYPCKGVLIRVQVEINVTAWESRD